MTDTRDGFDFLEGRGPGGPKPAEVIAFPLAPPPNIARAQIIRADAGILPTLDTPPPVSPERAGRLFMRAAREALGKFLRGEWLSDEEARYLETLDEMRRQGPKP
jgi:hypothetical protein